MSVPDAQETIEEEAEAGPRRVAPTIRDVAARCGLSIATVSRALNHPGQIAPSTRARVLEAVAAMRFRPNTIGRNLKRQRSTCLGLVVPSLANPVFADSVAGAQAAAREAGYTLLLVCTEYRAELETEALETLLAGRVDGLILTVAQADDNPLLDALDREGVPYVLLYNQPARAARAAVAVDNVAAAREGTAALIAAGHRRIAMVAGAFGASDRSRLRHQGYRAAMEAAGLAPLPPVEIGFDAADLAERLAPAFAAAGAPTALFCSTDLLALATMNALRGLGRSVPGDVALVGFDGIAVGAHAHPTLATIVQPARAMGEAAARHLVARLEAGEAPGLMLLPHRFRPGESLGPPSSSR